MVLILSAFNGIEHLVDGLYNKFEPDITITAAQGKVLYNDSLDLQSIAEIDEVALVTSGLEEVVILSKGNDRKTLCEFKGIEAAYAEHIGLANDMYSYFSRTRENKDTIISHPYLLHEGGENYMILGAGVASDIGLSFRNGESELFKVHAHKRGKRLSSAREKALNDNVALTTGCFSINAESDINYAIGTLEFARKVFDYPGQSSFIGIELENENAAEKVTAEIKKLISEAYTVQTRRENNPLVYETNANEKKATSLILSFVMLIAIFNGMASLTILMLEKNQDIQVFKAMGASKFFIKRIFMIEGVLINVFGAVVGILLGLTVCFLQIQFGIFGGAEGSIIEAYPVIVELADILWILATVISVGFIATYLMVTYLVSRLDLN